MTFSVICMANGDRCGSAAYVLTCAMLPTAADIPQIVYASNAHAPESQQPDQTQQMLGHSVGDTTRSLIVGSGVKERGKCLLRRHVARETWQPGRITLKVVCRTASSPCACIVNLRGSGVITVAPNHATIWTRAGVSTGSWTVRRRSQLHR